jgi:GNAT superfamily N-acetyltransferase
VRLSAEPRPEAVLDLLRDVWGSTMTRAEYDWLFARSGAFVNVAEDRGRLVGVAAMIPVRAVLEGEERDAVFAVSLATRTDARGQGVFSRLQRENEERAAAAGAAAALCFANAASRRVLVGRLGWREVAAARVWARPLLRHSPGDPFAAEAALFALHAPPGANHVVRSVEYLRGRYERSPRRYARVDGGIVGTTTRRGITFATAMEGKPRGAPHGRGLLRIGRAPGFVPTPWVLHLVAKELDERLALRSPWYPTLGDTDFL